MNLTDGEEEDAASILFISAEQGCDVGVGTRTHIPHDSSKLYKILFKSTPSLFNSYHRHTSFLILLPQCNNCSRQLNVDIVVCSYSIVLVHRSVQQSYSRPRKNIKSSLHDEGGWLMRIYMCVYIYVCVHICVCSPYLTWNWNSCMAGQG